MPMTHSSICRAIPNQEQSPTAKKKFFFVQAEDIMLKNQIVLSIATTMDAEKGINFVMKHTC